MPATRGSSSSIPSGSIPTRKYVDHETNADVTTHDERVRRNQFADGTGHVQHADGTEMDIGVGFVAVSLPAYALRVKVASSDTDVSLDDGGRMQLIWPILSNSMTGPVQNMNGPSALAPTKVIFDWIFCSHDVDFSTVFFAEC